MTRHLATVAAAFVLSTLSVGCVSQQTYDELDAAYRKSQEQLVECQAEIDRLNAALRLRDPSDALAEVSKLRAERDEWQQKYDALSAKYADLAGRPGTVVQLDPATDKALRDWAAQNADIAEYDEARGMVRLRSDLTFALGSDTVTPAAATTLGRLAAVLNGAGAAYEVRIVGHTDSVPISRPATLAAHKTNWHLGAHRAISVKDSLEKSGVKPVRMVVASGSMYRPVASNARGGTEANRRVEIFLAPMPPVNESFLGTGGAAAPAPAAPRDDDIPLK